MLGSHREPSDRMTARPSDDVRPRSLVHAYESVLQAASRLPPVVKVPSTYRRGGYRRYVRWLPRPTLLIQFFIIHHVRASLDHVRRRMLAISALGEGSDDDEAQREAVTQYLESLPTYHWTLYSVSLVLLTIVVTRFVLIQVPGAMEAFGGLSEQMGVTDRLLGTIRDASQSLSSIQDLLREIDEAPAQTTAFVFTSLVTVLYVELRLFVSSFRLMRAMCNLHPMEDLLTETPARWSMQRATGVYDLERSVGRRLNTRPPREVPFDLIVPALLMPSLLYLAVLFIQQGLRNLQALRPDASPRLSFIIAAAIVACVIARLAWLTRVWLRRQRPDGGPYLPSEVLIRDSQLIVAVRDPGTILWSTAVAATFCIGLGVGAASSSMDGPMGVDPFDAAIFLVLAFVIAPVWFLMNRDVSAYMAARGDPRPGRPVVSLLAMVVGGVLADTSLLITALFVLSSAYTTARRVERAAQIAGSDQRQAPQPALVTVGFVAFPLALAYVQRVLNALYSREGDLVDGPTVPTKLTVAEAAYPNSSTSTAVEEST